MCAFIFFVTTSFGLSRKIDAIRSLSSFEIRSWRIFLAFDNSTEFVSPIHLSSFHSIIFSFYAVVLFRLHCFYPGFFIFHSLVSFHLSFCVYLSYCLLSSYSIAVCCCYIVDLILTIPNWLLKSIVIVLSFSPFDQIEKYW